jgi:hypothetical protein
VGNCGRLCYSNDIGSYKGRLPMLKILQVEIASALQAKTKRA